MAGTSAHARAERCFALARSTSFGGERDAAIGRGTAIAESAGLSLDLFDIPGRIRTPRIEQTTSSDDGAGRPERYSREDLRDVMRSFDAHMREGGYLRDAFGSYASTLHRAAEAAGAEQDETVYEARRRNFERAAAEARARDEAREARR